MGNEDLFVAPLLGLDVHSFQRWMSKRAVFPELSSLAGLPSSESPCPSKGLRCPLHVLAFDLHTHVVLRATYIREASSCLRRALPSSLPSSLLLRSSSTPPSIESHLHPPLVLRALGPPFPHRMIPSIRTNPAALDARNCLFAQRGIENRRSLSWGTSRARAWWTCSPRPASTATTTTANRAAARTAVQSGTDSFSPRVPSDHAAAAAAAAPTAAEWGEEGIGLTVSGVSRLHALPEQRLWRPPHMARPAAPGLGGARRRAAARRLSPARYGVRRLHRGRGPTSAPPPRSDGQGRAEATQERMLAFLKG